MGGAAVSDYMAVFIPYGPKWTASSIMAMLLQKVRRKRDRERRRRMDVVNECKSESRARVRGVLTAPVQDRSIIFSEIAEDHDPISHKHVYISGIVSFFLFLSFSLLTPRAGIDEIVNGSSSWCLFCKQKRSGDHTDTTDDAAAAAPQQRGYGRRQHRAGGGGRKAKALPEV
jgi:hypothetical protein